MPLAVLIQRPAGMIVALGNPVVPDVKIKPRRSVGSIPDDLDRGKGVESKQRSTRLSS
jgi:hypothetical protein